MKINYPIKKTITNNSITNLGKRGMNLEDDINSTNLFYLETNRAVIHKKPTPVTVVHVKYPSRSKAVIDEAYYKVPSTTDYNGIYRSLYIDFEAKETSSKTSFPLKNIHAHQIEHLRKIIEHGGIAFLIIALSSLGKCYLIKAVDIIRHWDNCLNGNRKSIKISDIENEGFLINQGINPRLDYLKIVDEVFF